jgi:hypothetical protein
MSHESESDRTDRIRDSQMRDRNPGRSQNAYEVARKKNVPKAQEAAKPFLAEILNILPGGVRDVAVGVGYGLIPAILAAIFLPAAFKLVAVLVLLIAGATGYMLGKADG